MRIRRPKLGPPDHTKTPAQPGGGAAHLDPMSGDAATGSMPPHHPKSHPSLIALAKLIGRQTARDAARTGGGDE